MALDRHRATLAWNPPAEGDFRYELQERILSLDENGKIRSEWIPVSEQPTIDADGRATITFEKLRPGHPYMVRITSVKSDGHRSAPGPVFQFVTKPPPSFRPRLLTILLVAAALLVGLVVRQRYFGRDAGG